MKTSDQTDDCIVIGAGIAGLGAALRMRDAGKQVRVLEYSHRVGGRMTTDRIDGFTIDRGVTILGNDFKNLNSIIRRFGLQKHRSPIDFSFGLVEPEETIRVRAKRIDDLVFSRSLSFKSKLSAARVGLDVTLRRNKLLHGNSGLASYLDDVTVENYLDSINGRGFLDKVLFPGLATAFGGNIEKSSRLILLQTFRNIFLTSTYTLDEGVDVVPETLAKNLPVILNCEVKSVTYDPRGVQVTTNDGSVFTAKTVIFAIPGNRIPSLCKQLPVNLSQLLTNTRYGKMTDVHVALSHPINKPYAFMGASRINQPQFVLELERNRCKNLCPPGKDMLSIFWWDSNKKKYSTLDDGAVEEEAGRAMQLCLPGMINQVLFRHHVKWDEGIAYFPVGRISEVSSLRNEMKTWQIPLQFCGDYLDGLSCEGALKTGFEAAENINQYLNNHGI